jgi:hypothetical protein
VVIGEDPDAVDEGVVIGEDPDAAETGGKSAHSGKVRCAFLNRLAH